MQDTNDYGMTETNAENDVKSLQGESGSWENCGRIVPHLMEKYVYANIPGEEQMSSLGRKAVEDYLQKALPQGKKYKLFHHDELIVKMLDENKDIDLKQDPLVESALQQDMKTKYKIMKSKILNGNIKPQNLNNEAVTQLNSDETIGVITPFQVQSYPPNYSLQGIWGERYSFEYNWEFDEETKYFTLLNFSSEELNSWFEKMSEINEDGPHFLSGTLSVIQENDDPETPMVKVIYTESKDDFNWRMNLEKRFQESNKRDEVEIINSNVSKENVSFVSTEADDRNEFVKSSAPERKQAVDAKKQLPEQPEFATVPSNSVSTDNLRTETNEDLLVGTTGWIKRGEESIVAPSNDNPAREFIKQKAIEEYLKKALPGKEYILLYPDEVKKEMEENQKNTSSSTQNDTDNVIYVINAQPKIQRYMNKNFKKEALSELNPNENYRYNGQPVHFLDGTLEIEWHDDTKNIYFVQVQATYTESDSDRSWRKTLANSFQKSNKGEEFETIKSNVPNNRNAFSPHLSNAKKENQTDVHSVLPKRPPVSEKKQLPEQPEFATLPSNSGSIFNSKTEYDSGHMWQKNQTNSFQTSNNSERSEIIKSNVPNRQPEVEGAKKELPKPPKFNTVILNSINRDKLRKENIKKFEAYCNEVVQTEVVGFTERLVALNEVYKQFLGAFPKHEHTQTSSLLFDEEEEEPSFFNSTIKIKPKVKQDGEWERVFNILKEFIEKNIQNLSAVELEGLKELEISNAQISVKFNGVEINKLKPLILKCINDKLDDLYLNDIEKSDYFSGEEIAKKMANPLKIADAYEALKNKIPFNNPGRNTLLTKLRTDLNLLEKTKTYLALGFSNQESYDLISRLQEKMIAKERSGKFTIHSESELSRKLEDLKKSYPVVDALNKDALGQQRQFSI